MAKRLCTECNTPFDPEKNLDQNSRICRACTTEARISITKSTDMKSTLNATSKEITKINSSMFKIKNDIKSMEAMLHRGTAEDVSLLETRIKNARAAYKREEVKLEKYKEDLQRIKKGGTSKILEEARLRQTGKKESN